MLTKVEALAAAERADGYPPGKALSFFSSVCCIDVDESVRLLAQRPELAADG